METSDLSITKIALYRPVLAVKMTQKIKMKKKGE
jgi:hypothetical protein